MMRKAGLVLASAMFSKGLRLRLFCQRARGSGLIAVPTPWIVKHLAMKEDRWNVDNLKQRDHERDHVVILIHLGHSIDRKQPYVFGTSSSGLPRSWPSGRAVFRLWSRLLEIPFFAYSCGMDRIFTLIRSREQCGRRPARFRFLGLYRQQSPQDPRGAILLRGGVLSSRLTKISCEWGHSSTGCPSQLLSRPALDGERSVPGTCKMVASSRFLKL